MKIDELNSNHIAAEEGKVFRRISDQVIFGNEIYLGYTYYLAGEKLEEPLLELPEHFEEIDDPQINETVLLDENIILDEDYINEDIALLELEEVTEVTVSEPKRQITIADYLELERKVNELFRLL